MININVIYKTIKR